MNFSTLIDFISTYHKLVYYEISHLIGHLRNLFQINTIKMKPNKRDTLHKISQNK